MKILHINNLSSGSIINQVIYPLVKALEMQGCNNYVFTPDVLKQGGWRNWVLFFAVKLKLIVEKTLRKLITNNDYYFYNIFEKVTLISSEMLFRKYGKIDMIVLYWTSGIINAKTIHKLSVKTGARIFIYPMDMGPLAGGCHYKWDCNGFKTNCTNCPGLKKPFKFIAVSNLTYRSKYLSRIDVGLLLGTTDLMRDFTESMIFKDHGCNYLPLGIDGRKYRPSNTRDSYESKKSLLIGASTPLERRKGMAILKEALLLLQKDCDLCETVELVIIGNRADDFFSDLAFHKKYLGFIGETELISSYQECYCFVSASIEDAGPMMVNQALICGKPVVAFEVGVAKDLVVDGSTGFLAKSKNAVSLRDALKKMLNLSVNEYEEMCFKARNNTIELYEVERVASKLLNIMKNGGIRVK
ncbi:MAG: glycosyltransferase [Sphingobacteriaceae bacterium]|nr:glycosyltransferase [Sphingobacteriaceae bacterium]